MNLEDLRGAWQASQGGGPGPEDAGLLERVLRQAGELDRRVRRRDRIETAAVLFVGGFFAWSFPDAPGLARLGIVLVLLGCVLIVVRLRRARSAAGGADPDAPLADRLRHELDRVVAQIRLLESVLWWYLLPLSAGVVLVFAGHAGWGWSTLLYAVAVTLLAVVIYAANQYAVRRSLRPQRAELERLLRQLRG